MTLAVTRIQQKRQHPHPSRASHDPTFPIEGEVWALCFFVGVCSSHEGTTPTSPRVGGVDSSVAMNRVGGVCIIT
jgi:hypothetical protein